MKGMNIKSVWARQILDSRGNPTVEVDVTLDNGIMGRAAVPSGASTGAFEAVELRDDDKKNYMGKSVEKAVANVNKIIAKKIKGMSVEEQENIDNTMIALDGTHNKGKLGANAILGVSLAVAKARAQAKGVSLFKELGNGKGNTLPVPMMNILNGGKHADNSVNCQEYMIMPVGAKSWSEALKWCVEIFHNLKAVLKKDGYATSVGDEGGFAPPLDTAAEAMETIVSAVSDAGYTPGKDVFLALDAASSEFYADGVYDVDGLKLSAPELADHYKSLADQFPLISIEDPFFEDDFETTRMLTEKIGSKVQIVGDDLFVTNTERLSKGIDMGAANALLLKVNQIGTITEAGRAAEMSFANGYNVVVSHRSGESEDVSIADLSVGWGAGQIKTGAPARGERTAKYNQLLRIEEELGSKAVFPGIKAFRK